MGNLEKCILGNKRKSLEYKQKKWRKTKGEKGNI